MDIYFPEGLLTVALSYFFICSALHLSSSFLLFSSFPFFKELSDVNQYTVPNKVVAGCHAVIMSSRALLYWRYYLSSNNLNVFSFFTQDFSGFPPISMFVSSTIDLMLGYLIYDTIYEVLARHRDSKRGKNSKEKESGGTPIVLHHVLGFISHLVTRYYMSAPAAFYSMMVYLAEISTPFLHMSWVFKQLGPDYSSLMMFCGSILLLAFTIFRVVLSPLLLFHLVQNWTFTNEDGSVSVFEYYFLYYMNLAIVVFFVLLNYFWYFQLLKIFFVKEKSKKKTV